MLPTKLFLLSAILIAGNFYFVVADDESSTCVSECPVDEIYSECGNNGCQNTCANPNIAPLCKGTCIAGCICAEGLLRNSKGVCVNPADCDTCKANEVFSPCGNHGCLSTCAEPDLIERCDYKPGCYPGCICDEGFLRDPSGNCIPEENCKCPVDEIYSECGNNACQNTCAKPNIARLCKGTCIAGCICAEGLLRNSKGVCGNPAECDNGCGGDPDAYFSGCGDPCPVTCNNMAKGGLSCDLCLPEGGCKCKEGFVKDIHGKCIKPCDCPKCGPDEVFACGSACDTTCATLGDTCPIINIKCNDKCYCVDGYARDKKNVCIPIKQCPAKFTCPKTQVYNPCPLICPGVSGCAAYILGLHSAPVCIASNTRVCKPKCECKTGLILKSEKECVKPEQCCADPNAEVVSCPNPCPGGTCDSPEFANCKAACRIRGCQCKSGYVLDAQGKCILLSKCPKSCKAHEVFKNCGTKCQPTCNNRNPKCTKECSKGCFCKEGYIRQNGVCIPVKHCSKKCKAHEVFKDCGTKYQPTCNNRNPICSKECAKGCFCKEGYIRQNGVCIPVKKCPKCGAHEVFKECGTRCPPTCDVRHPVCTKDCAAGCFCKDGYIRQNGKCIPVKKCPKCGSHEVFQECGTKCQPTCNDRNPIGTADCAVGCFCKNGYIRQNGTCIPVQNSLTKCGAHEVFTECGSRCPASCGLRHPFCSEYCVTGCFCEDGYVRHHGPCIPESDCPKCPPNEVFGCGSACDTTCATLGNECHIINDECTDKCYCKRGYARDTNNVCIPLEQCAPRFNCTGLRVYRPCPDICPEPQTCELFFMDVMDVCYPPPDIQECRPRCECETGLYLKSNNECVEAYQCCDDPNARVVSCPNPCPGGTCENPEFADCGIRCQQARGCQCNSGYLLDAQGKCIEQSECPPKCNANEVYKECGTKCPSTCANRNPICTKECVPGCFCADGYIRQNGQCIPVEDCPKCGANEVFACGSACDTTCATLGDTCPIINKKCNDKCYCVDGYARDKNNVCIPVKQCPPKCGANEVFACGSACDTTCATLGQVCPIVNIKCNDMCYCIDGFARDSNNVCVPVEQCPPSKTCPGPNELYSECGGCEKTCENKDLNLACAAVCLVGCFCQKGYVRKDGICSLPEECPPACTKENEEYNSCGTRCPATCDNRSPICTKECVPGCACKDGYILNNGNCILVADCPPTCTKVNEVYKSCGTRCPPTCDNRSPICTKECFPGCACQDGYILNNGNCILVADCPKTPPPKKCSLNEEYFACPAACPVEPSCTSLLALGQPECSPEAGDKCLPACKCKAGYVRDSNKQCVLPEKCCTDSNSELVDNPKCCPGGTCANPEFSPCRIACPSKGCQCKKGFLKKSNTDKTCVAVSECCECTTTK